VNGSPRPTTSARAAEAWRRLWFTQVPPHIYAALRIALGLSGLAILLTRSDISAFWDPAGFVPWDVGPASAVKRWLVANDFGWIAGRLLYAGSAVVLVAMTLGLWTRMTVPLSFLAALVQQAWNPLPMTGADGALRAFLFCLMWTDSGAVWSVDASRTGRDSLDAAPPLRLLSIAPLRLMRFQLALIYLSAGLYKIDSVIWRNGSAVYYVLNSNVHQRVGYFVPPEFEVVTTLATYLTLLWELGFTILILFKSTRRWALMLGVGIHLGMFTFMEVGPFHLVMLASYVAFLDPARVGRLAGPLRRAYRSVSVDHDSVLPPDELGRHNPPL
jgi:hypothetical protein